MIARDYGFAPNPFYGICTLATCKPIIRKLAQINDWIIGTGSKQQSKHGCIVFAMRVTETLTYDGYWNDSRFQSKKPTLRGSKKQAFGDNIYHRKSKSHPWQQENSHHSLADGSANALNVLHDTQSNRILLSSHYRYWGLNSPTIPAQFRDYDGVDVCAGRGHKSRFSEQFINDFVSWIDSFFDYGYLGEPIDWSKSP